MNAAIVIGACIGLIVLYRWLTKSAREEQKAREAAEKLAWELYKQAVREGKADLPLGGATSILGDWS
ncbi:MAG: hypothetical protein E6R03_03670 [Hyphomicrobiaceae bacterium]|nr:MAG: hypothetical protein E6R03_03670 [Hyphomicrobiaceae bacterium]